VIGFLAAILATSPSLFSVFIPIKVALVSVLFYAWGRHLPKAFQLGLFFAWIGDIALLWPEREALFMVGMGSFTLMWVSYGVGWRLSAGGLYVPKIPYLCGPCWLL
jgi:hypothetical protein